MKKLYLSLWFCFFLAGSSFAQEELPEQVKHSTRPALLSVKVGQSIKLSSAAKGLSLNLGLEKELIKGFGISSDLTLRFMEHDEALHEQNLSQVLDNQIKAMESSISEHNRRYLDIAIGPSYSFPLSKNKNHQHIWLTSSAQAGFSLIQFPAYVAKFEAYHEQYLAYLDKSLSKQWFFSASSVLQLPLSAKSYMSLGLEYNGRNINYDHEYGFIGIPPARISKKLFEHLITVSTGFNLKLGS